VSVETRSGTGGPMGLPRVAGTLLRHTRRSAIAVVELYEHSAGAVADFETRLTDTAIEPTASVGAAHADLLRELTHAQVVAVRVLFNL
jgi:hypothetical protein